MEIEWDRVWNVEGVRRACHVMLAFQTKTNICSPRPSHGSPPMYECTEKGVHYWRESVKTAVAINKVEKDADIWNMMWTVNCEWLQYLFEWYGFHNQFNILGRLWLDFLRGYHSFKKYFLVEKLILILKNLKWLFF